MKTNDSTQNSPSSDINSCLPTVIVLGALTSVLIIFLIGTIIGITIAQFNKLTGTFKNQGFTQ